MTRIKSELVSDIVVCAPHANMCIAQVIFIFVDADLSLELWTKIFDGS